MDRKAYLASLRNKWQLAREAVTQFTEDEQLTKEHLEALKIVPTMSPTGFMFVKMQMTAQNLE